MKHRRTLAAAGGVVALILSFAACGAEGGAVIENEITSTPDAVAPEGDEAPEPAEPVVITPDFGDGPWAEEFARAFEDNDSPFVLGVLADGVITEREFVEAMTEVAECLTLEGIRSVPSFDPDQPGSIAFYEVDENGRPLAVTPDSDLGEMLRLVGEVCGPPWLGANFEIPTLYGQTVQNPLNLDRDELFIACLVDGGLAPEGLTLAEFQVLDEEVEGMWAALLGEDGTRFMPENGEWGVIHGMTITPIPPEQIPSIPQGASMSDPGVQACRVASGF